MLYSYLHLYSAVHTNAQHHAISDFVWSTSTDSLGLVGGSHHEKQNRQRAVLARIGHVILVAASKTGGGVLGGVVTILFFFFFFYHMQRPFSVDTQQI